MRYLLLMAFSSIAAAVCVICSTYIGVSRAWRFSLLTLAVAFVVISIYARGHLRLREKNQPNNTNAKASDRGDD
jgi:hypothetical protein